MAEALLTHAITIRQRTQDSGWLSYEFNRAYCRIRLDGAFQTQQPSAPEARAAIVLICGQRSGMKTSAR